jgi:hypothetical protein
MCPCQLTRQRCACCVRVLIRQSCGERCGPPKGCDTAGYRLRAQHSPGFVSPAGMSIIYGTPPFSAVQSNQVGGIGRSSMPTSVPPASVTCTRGFRRRFADLLPGGGPLAHRERRRVRRGRDRMAACRPLVCWACPGPPRWECPRTATTRSSRGPARPATDPGAPGNRVVIVEFSPQVPVAPWS